MIRMIGVSCLICIFSTSLIAVNTASECEYGSVQAWFQASNQIWENATAHPMLKRGEIFYIKIVVTVNTDLQVFFLMLHEFGTPVYEVIEGPSAMEQPLECRKMIIPGQPITYVWKMQVRANTTWVNGTAPLEVFVQFNKNDADISLINFDVITAYVSDRPLEDPPLENIKNKSIPVDILAIEPIHLRFAGMVIIILLLSIFLSVKHHVR